MRSGIWGCSIKDSTTSLKRQRPTTHPFSSIPATSATLPLQPLSRAAYSHFYSSATLTLLSATIPYLINRGDDYGQFPFLFGRPLFHKLLRGSIEGTGQMTWRVVYYRNQKCTPAPVWYPPKNRLFFGHFQSFFCI
jgi:hypothetical protein